MNTSFKSYLTSVAPSKEAGYSLWKAAKNLRRAISFNSPLRNEDGSWARSDHQKAELFSSHFENTFRDNDIVSNIKSETLDSVDNNEEIIRPTSPQEVTELIDQLN